MDEENPYLPPTTDEPEALSGPGWKLMGLTLLVNHGTTLPKVDLESGISTGELKNVELRHRKKIPNFNGLIIALIFLWAALSNLIRDWEDRWILPYAAATIGVIRYIRKSRKPPSPSRNGIISIREFITPKRLSRQIQTKFLRYGFMFVVAASFFVFMAISSTRKPDFDLIIGLLGIASAIVVGIAIWGFSIRPKLKISEGVGDSIAISPIHPDAFEFLRRLAEEEHHPANVTNPHMPLPRPVSRNAI